MNDRMMAKAEARAEWKRIEARLLRALAVQCRLEDLQHWRPCDIADQLDLEAERREHPERFKESLRLPMYHPGDVAGVSDPIAVRPTYDELQNAVIAWSEEGDPAYLPLHDLAARLRVTGGAGT